MPGAARTDPNRPPTRRERVRAATIEEIKETATRLMRTHGQDLRFADIAREMGITAPALYRYFADRDELLAALMVDGFRELAVALQSALEASAPGDLARRVRAAATTYREFANADAQRFALLFGLPNPGYVHGEHSSGPAAGATMAELEQLLRVVIDEGDVPTPLVRDVGPTLAGEVVTAQAAEGARIPADAYQALLHVFAAVHGFACLEVFDHLSWLSAEARDELFEAQIELLAAAMGAHGSGVGA